MNLGKGAIHAGLLATISGPPTLVSLLAYVVGMIVSFIGQSRFTFRVRQRSTAHLRRFLGLSAMGLGVSFFAIDLATKNFGMSAAFGTIVTAFIIPDVDFTVMKIWVFRADGEGS